MNIKFDLCLGVLLIMVLGDCCFSETPQEQEHTQKPVIERTISTSDIPSKEASFEEKMSFFYKHEKEISRDLYASYLSNKHPRIDIGEPTGLKQLTNEEMIREKVDRINPLDRYPLFTDMTVAMSKQEYYDDTLKRLFWDKGLVPFQEWDALELDVLKHFAWDVELNQDSYLGGEPIGIRIFLKNVSDQDVKMINGRIFPGFMLNSIELKQLQNLAKKYRDVYLTRDGHRLFHQLPYPSDFGGNAQIVLKPGQRILVTHKFALNHYYDLTANGVYELTFYRRVYVDDEQMGKYPKPHTIRFQVKGLGYWLDDQVEWPESDDEAFSQNSVTLQTETEPPSAMHRKKQIKPVREP